MTTATAASSGASSSRTSSAGPRACASGTAASSSPSAPDILYLKDTDGDRKADRKEVVFTGFRRDNVQALLSNLRWGLDNWFTGSSGQDGGRVRSLRKPDQAEVAVEGRHFRFRPTGEIEALSGDGRFSNTSDDFGRRFCSATTSPVRHVVIEDRYLRRNPHLPVAAVVHAAAAEGSSGPVYPASAPEPWRVLGTAYFMSARAESVIGSIERGGAVTGFFTGATGPLIYRGTALGEACYGQYFIGECGMNLVHRRTLTPVGCTFRADRVEPESEFLASTDNWFRPVSLANGPDGALYICDMYRETIEHPWSIPPSIKRHLDLRSGRERGRIWRVTAEGAPPYRKPRLGGAGTAELVEALRRPDAWWRETAARLLFQRQDRSAVGPLERLVAGAERPATRAAALWALEGLGALRPEVAEAALKDASSGVREQAVRLARVETLLGFDDPDARVRMELAYRMGETDDPRATDVLARLAGGADVWLRTAIVSSSGRRAVELLRRLADDEIAPMIAVTIGARNDEAEIAAALGLARGSPTILRGLGDGLNRANRSLASIPALAPVFEEAERAALDGSKPVAGRVEAVRVLSYGTFAAARRCLPRLLDARAPAPVRLAALRSLVAFPDREVGSLLLEAWPTLDAEARRESLAWFRPADRQALLVEAMEEGRVSPAEIGADLRRTLLGNQALAGRAEVLVGTAGAGDRRAEVQAYRPALGEERRRHRRPGGLPEELRRLPPDRGRRARGRPEPGLDPHEGARRDPRPDPGPEPPGRPAVRLVPGPHDRRPGRRRHPRRREPDERHAAARRGGDGDRAPGEHREDRLHGRLAHARGAGEGDRPGTDVRPHRFLEEPLNETRHDIEPAHRPRRLRLSRGAGRDRVPRGHGEGEDHARGARLSARLRPAPEGRRRRGRTLDAGARPRGRGGPEGRPRRARTSWASPLRSRDRSVGTRGSGSG